MQNLQKTTLLLLGGALSLNCQNEVMPVVERLNLPRIELHSDILTSSRAEDKNIQYGGPCIIDISDHFIPEILSRSRDAEQYFTVEGILSNPWQRERFGIFSSFEHHQKPFEHYAEAITRRGEQKQPKIELKFVPYTTKNTIQKIYSLEKQLQNGQLSENQKLRLTMELKILQSQVQTIKNAQQILAWEDFYREDIDGIYDQKTALAVIKYQRYHQQHLRYGWNIDGRINRSTIELLNKNLEDYAFDGMRRVLEERVFHAKCGSRYPLVIEPQELEKLVDDAAAQLQLDTLQGVKNFFLSPERESAEVHLEIPQRYQQDSMKLEMEVEKWDFGRWERVRTETKLRLYVIEDGKKVELFQTKAVDGGWGKMRGIKKFFKTPEGEFYLKSLLVMPHWNPPSWSKDKYGDPVTLPGQFNAFGMMATVLHYTDAPQENPFRGWQGDDDGFRIHLTAWPSSVESGYGVSHGCVRIHPAMSRMFYFVAGYTPHNQVLEKDTDGKETLRYTEKKGSYIPFEPEHYIKVRICKEKCE